MSLKLENRTSSQPWYHLTGTGFNVQSEVQMLSRGLKEGRLDQAISDARGDLIGFKFEYLAQRSILPNPVEIALSKDRRRLVSAISKNPLTDMITRDERQGAVQDAMDSIEKFLLDAPNESMAIMTSAPGKSGLTDGNGRDIIYSDSQTYMFRKNADGSLESYTMVTSMSLNENRHLLGKLRSVSGQSIVNDKKEFQTDYDYASDLVRNVALIDGNQSQLDFKDIANMVEQTRAEIGGTKVSRIIKNGEGIQSKYFSEIYSDLGRRDQLMKIDSTLERLIQSFEQFVRDNLNSLYDPSHSHLIEKRLAITILEMMQQVQGKTDIASPARKETYYHENAKALVAQLATYGGCNGGGQVGFGLNMPQAMRPVVVNSVLGPRMAMISLFNKEAKWSYHDGNCITCTSEEERQKTKQVGPCSICQDCEKRLS